MSFTSVCVPSVYHVEVLADVHSQTQGHKPVNGSASIGHIIVHKHCSSMLHSNCSKKRPKKNHLSVIVLRGEIRLFRFQIIDRGYDTQT